MKKRRIFILMMTAALTCGMMTGCSLTDRFGTPGQQEEDNDGDGEGEGEGSEDTEEPGGNGGTEDNGNADGGKDTSESVKNNGSQFVKVGDTVYFRQYDGDVTDLTYNFTNACVTGGNGSMMMIKDGETAVSTAFADTGYGDFFYYDGRFYGMKMVASEGSSDTDDSGYSGYDQLKSVVYSVRPDGSDEQVIADGTIENITADGSSYAIQNYTYGGQNTYIVYRDGEEYLDLSDVDSPDALGVCGDYVVYTDWKYDEICVFSENPLTGDKYELGSIEYSDELGYPSVEEFEADGQKVYISGGYYAGSMNMLQRVFTFVADVDGPNNTAVVSDSDAECSAFILKDGEMVMTEGKPFSVSYGQTDNDLEYKNENMELFYFDENGKKVCTGINLFSGSETDPGVVCTFVNHGAYIDGTLYYMANTCLHTWADDIGWRYSYRILATDYGIVDTDSLEQSSLVYDEYDDYIPMRVYLFEEEGDKPTAVLGQNYSCYLDDSGEEESMEVEMAYAGEKYELSQDFVLVAYPGLEGEYPEGGADALYEIINEHGSGDTFISESDMDEYGDYNVPTEYFPEDYTNGYKFMDFGVVFDGNGRIKIMMPDFAG
ncbi:MAG: hypothetical protein IKO53_07430 [Lachnospiraceae bacterium]|nr:hypothetical protein [Lachnospiraceae bacterium]